MFESLYVDLGPVPRVHFLPVCYTHHGRYIGSLYTVYTGGGSGGGGEDGVCSTVVSEPCMGPMSVCVAVTGNQ